MRETIRKNKTMQLITAVIILLPMLAGVTLWDRLPEQVATHWGVDGEPNGWSSRGFAVFGLPLVLLALHFVCMAVSERGGKVAGNNPKLLRIVHGLCPAISLIAGFAVYSHALGVSFDMNTPALLLLGALLLVVGNYLPKCTRNPHLGIKLPWTLADDDNWRATHRLGGRVWMAAGLLMILCALLPQEAGAWAGMAVLLAAVLIPTVYSYYYHRTHSR